jgi:hypothetical protein
MDRPRALTFKALKRLVAALLLTLLLAAICLAVAPTLGYAQELEPTRQCVDFSDWEEGEVEAEFTKDGFVFTALDEEPQFIYLTDTPQVLGLLIAEIGVNIGFPQTTSRVTLSTVSYTSSPLEITAFNPEGATVTEAIAPSVPEDTIHTVSLTGLDIVRLVIRGGGEGFLVEICIAIEAEEVAEEPFIEVVDPPEGHCGSTIQLSIFGNNFEKGSSVFIPKGIETLYTEFISPEELRVEVFIAENAPPGARPVTVSGPELGTAILEGSFTVICPPPEMAGRPDLTIIELEWEIVEEGRLLLIVAQVRNAGDAQAPEATLYAESQAARWWAAEAIVPELRSGNSAQVVIESAIPDELRESTHFFRVDVDHWNEIIELNEDNNWRGIEVWVPPPEEPEPEENQILVVILVIGGSAIVACTILTVRRSVKVRRRKEWQEKAEEEEPQEPCEPGNRRCQWKESKCELAQCKVKHLMLLAYDAVSGELSKKRQVEGEIVDGLNRVIAASRRGEKPEKLVVQIAPLAYVLLQQIIEWLRPEPAPRDVSIIGHLEGCKVTYKFILKRCKETRTWGEPEEEWEATIKEERDEPLGVLRDLDPTKPRIPEHLTPELTRLLMQFIEKV